MKEVKSLTSFFLWVPRIFVSMNQAVAIGEVLRDRLAWQIIDVRSPSEYATGHIPGAINLPLFSDEERAKVGTLYKQDSPETAMHLGLEFAGAKMADLVEAIRTQRDTSGKKLLIHCWRGGKRSQAVHWLASFSGMEVSLLTGGYKQYRRALHDFFAQLSTPLMIVGGCTGSGKTEVLYALKALGEQIVDLEKLAHHKGSAFGGIGEAKQPTTEQFENDVFEAFRQLNPERPIWLENESKSIGRVYVPDSLWHKMRASQLFTIQVDRPIRLQRVMRYYADVNDVRVLRDAFEKIKKRLGGLDYQHALDALDSGNLTHAASIALDYYDKSYTFQLGNWVEGKTTIIAPCNDVHDTAIQLKKASKKVYS